MSLISPVKNWHIVTNCSSIKKRVDASITADCLRENFNDFCIRWTTNVKFSNSKVSALETYGGRAFIEAVSAARKLGTELHVVSAGLGLISESQQIPNYSLTISKGNGSIASWLREQEKSSSDWWTKLNLHLGKSNSIQKLIKSSEGVILALPSTYLEMIAKELEQLDEKLISKIFIISSTAGQQMLSEKLKNRALPYNENLDGSENYQGTRNDFAQRALKHFVTEIDFKNRDINDIKNAITSYLNLFEKPVIPVRAKLNDDAILLLIERNWSSVGGTRDKLHRYLRDSALVACEQNRFGILWNKVREKKQKESSV